MPNSFTSALLCTNAEKSIKFASKFRVIPLNLTACSNVQYAEEDTMSFF